MRDRVTALENIV